MKPTSMKPSRKLSPSTLGAHNKSTRRHSRQQFVSSWITSQTETDKTVDEAGTSCTTSTGHPKPQSQSGLEVATPAITLTTPDQDEAEATEIVPIKFRPISLSATPLPSDSPFLPTATPRTATDSVGIPPQHPRLSPHGTRGGGGRRASIYPSMNLVDEHITEEEAEVDGDSEEEKPFLSSEEAHHTAVSILHPEVIIVNPEIQIDEPMEGSSSSNSLQGPSRIRSRALSYPAESHPPVLPLIELPGSHDCQHKESQPDLSAKPESEMEAQQTERPGSTVGKFVHVAIMAKRWKKRSTDGEVSSVLEQSAKEAQITRQKKRPFIEVPRVLKLELLEEAYPIVQKTYNMYKSQLGPRHKLTLLAEKHMQDLASKLGRQSS